MTLRLLIVGLLALLAVAACTGDDVDDTGGTEDDAAVDTAAPEAASDVRDTVDGDVLDALETHFTSELWVPDDVEVVSARTLSAGEDDDDEVVVFLRYRTEMAVDELADEYRKRLREDGWRIRQDTSREMDYGQRVMIGFEREDERGDLTLTEQEEDGGTGIRISLRTR